MHVPVPYTFNIIKHYLTGARAVCRKAAKSKKNELWFFNEINKTGSNLLDVYTGKMELPNILRDISDQLLKMNAYNREELINHLKNREYIVIKIKDDSQWIVRLGDDKTRYIHIHPARTGKHVQRFHSNAWKTALAMYMRKLCINRDTNTLTQINHIRTTFLDLPPVKRITANSRIEKAYTTFIAE